jgi:L-threonylcarbamoyladenylate synthase
MGSNAEIAKMPAIATVVAQASPEAIEQARSALSAGRLVAFPTETVYGLGADATNDRAVAMLYAAKERPSFNPLIAHVADLAAARRLAQFDAEASKLAQAFWPGPLTLVLPKRRDCPVGQLATSGLDTIAVRLPSHPVARDIIAAFGKPVVAPSANRSGRVSPTCAKHVQADLAGRIDLIIDGGPSPLGLESTVLACLGQAVLLRPGATPRATLERCLGHDIAAAALASPGPLPDPRAAEGREEAAGRKGGGRADGGSRPMAPGMLVSHYAPDALLRMNAVTVAPGEALLAFGATLPNDAGNAQMVLNLSAGGDLVEAAANLFDYLRQLDGAGVSSIAVMPIPDEGLGEAINDRLRRAAAPRHRAILNDSTAEGELGSLRSGIT